jgi:hypothetical protein
MSSCKHGGRDVYEKPDMVSHPAHYTQGGIECKDAIKAALTPEEYRGWIKGSAIAYLWRERLKNGQEDIDKAIDMLSWTSDTWSDDDEEWEMDDGKIVAVVIGGTRFERMEGAGE